jgi:hypothetical protein
LKKRHPPHLAVLHENLKACLENLLFVYFDRVHFKPLSRKSTKFVFEFCGLDLCGKLAPVDIATFSCFNQDFSMIFHTSPLPFRRYREDFLGHSSLLFRTSFWVGIPQWVGFSRPQLVVVSGLFGWESLSGWDFLGHNLLLSQASLGGNPSVDGIF